MTNHNRESERLQQYRAQQLQACDPMKKERKKQDHITRQFQSRKKYSLATSVSDLDYKWKGAIIGFVSAFMAWIILGLTVQNSWVDLVGLFAIIAFPLIGVVLGSSFDWRDNLRDL